MLASSTGATIENNSTVVPMITHTAATPQDSPSTTLEPGATFRDFNVALTLEKSTMLSSLDSIDRTSVCIFMLNIFAYSILFNYTFRSIKIFCNNLKYIYFN